MSKINIVRSIKTKNIKEDLNHNREMAWDNRFHLAKPQPYDAYTDAYFVNMKILRDQFKIMEQTYNKNSKPAFFVQEKRFKSSEGGSNYGNSMINNTNIHGSYNNYMQNNGNLHINDKTMTDPFLEELNTLISLWEDLGVTDNYKVIFESLAKDIDPLMRKDLYESEILSLRKFSELLLKISREIENREELIVKIHVINDTFLGADKKDEIFSEFVLHMKNLRITSINIINYLQKIREQCSYNVLGGKYNLDKINKIYKFDKNYLIKMKFDMDFLCNSKIANFYDFESCESDPFLLYFFFKNENMEKKHSIRISDDMLSSVKQGQYLIMQDLIFFNINSIFMKNLQRQEKNLSRIKGIYGRDFSQPLKNSYNSAGKPRRLYSPQKKQENDPKSSTLGFNNFSKNTNTGSANVASNNKTAHYKKDKDKDKENQFQATSTNFYKTSNNLKSIKPQTASQKFRNNSKEENLKKDAAANNANNGNQIVNNNINDNINNNVENNQVNNNTQNIQQEFINPMGFSMNNKDFPVPINPNFFFLNNNMSNANNANANNQNNNNNMYDPYMMNMYQNAQMSQMAFNSFSNPFMFGYPPNFPMNFMNPQRFNFNSFNNAFGNNPIGAMGFNSNYPNENLIVANSNKIEIISASGKRRSNKNLKKQNTDKSLHDSSKIIKVKTEEIIAIDKKEINNKNMNKINDSSNKSIRSEEEFNIHEKFNRNNEKAKNNKMDISYSKDNSSFTKKLEEELSIHDEMQSKQVKSKISENLLKGSNNNINNNKYSENNKALYVKTESDIQEDDNSDIRERFKGKKSLEHDFNKDSIYNHSHDEDLPLPKYKIEVEKKNSFKKQKTKEDEIFEESYKKSLNNSNISENLSYKQKNEKITNFDEFNNRENSIDEINDSKSLKEIENKIKTDFINDSPMIEEINNNSEMNSNMSPKNLISHPSKLGGEMKYEKLEIINEESIDKSKSNLKESNKKYENKDMNISKNKELYEDNKIRSDNKNEDIEYDNEMEMYEEEIYGNSQDIKVSKSMSRDGQHAKKIGELNPHETFDSLKSNTVKSHKLGNEELQNKRKITKPNEIIKTEEHSEYDKNNNSKYEEELHQTSKLSNAHISIFKYFLNIHLKAYLNNIEEDPLEEIEANIQNENYGYNEINKNQEENVDNYEAYEGAEIKEANYNNEILEEDDLIEGNEKEVNNSNIIQKEKKVTDPNNNEEFSAKNEFNKITDPDAIEEENIPVIEEEQNKSFKSKKSNYSQKKIHTEEEKNQMKFNKTNEDEIIEEDQVKANYNTNSNNTSDKKENFEFVEKGIFRMIKNQIKVSFFSGENLEAFEKDYSNYKEKLNLEQIITFKPKETITEYLSFFNPKIIKITDENSAEENDLIGLCCLSFDNTWDETVKLNINHLSCLNFEYFDEMVNLILEFIKSNFFIDEIIVELHYELKDNNFEINEGIRDSFKKNFNFKWYKLENKNGERSQKLMLAIKSKENNMQSKNELAKFMNSTLEINHYSVINIIPQTERINYNLDPTKNYKFDVKDLNNMNYFSLLSSLCLLVNSNEHVNSEILEKYDIEKIKRLCKNFINSFNLGVDYDKDKYHKVFDLLPDEIKKEVLLEEDEKQKKSLSLMKLSLKFSSLLTTKLNEFIYNRVEGSISTLINEELNHKFYVILTSDGNYTVMITELKDGLKEFLNKNKEQNIYKIFDELYNNLKNTEQDATEAKPKSIWVPSFIGKQTLNLDINHSGEDENNNENYPLLNDIKNSLIENSETGENKNVQKILQSYNLIFRYDKEFQNNPILNPMENDIVIKDTFLISVINLDILADSQISTVFLSVIDKEYWIPN